MQQNARICIAFPTAEATIKPIIQSPYSIKFITQTTRKPTSTSSRITIQVQLDGGANRSLTNDKSILHNYKEIARYPMMGIKDNDVALTCTGKGYIPWCATTGDLLYVPCYYSPDAAETIILPTNVVLSHSHLYNAFSQFGHCTTGKGNVTFYRNQGTSHAIFDLHLKNGLWYNESIIPEEIKPIEPNNQPRSTIHAKINRMNGQVRYVYYHQKYCHPGKKKLGDLHKHIIGINHPPKGNVFFDCASCWHGKPKKGEISKKKWRQQQHTHHKTRDTFDVYSPEALHTDVIEEIFDYLDTVDPIPAGTIIQNAEQFHMDFGFARGTQFHRKMKKCALSRVLIATVHTC